MDFKKREIYSKMTLPVGKPFFVRLDGRAFHNFSEKIRMKRPFDERFAKAMAKTAETFFQEFNPCLAYVFSDEINLLFLQASSFRRVEKIDSVFAGIASAKLSSELKCTASFDCRCIPIEKKEIIKYLVWRQAEAIRNCDNAYAQHLLQTKEKMSAKAAADKLRGIKTKKLVALRKKYMKNIPAWHERGILLYKQKCKKAGFDPIKRKKVLAERYKVLEDWKPPVFSKNKKFFERQIR